VKPVEFAAFNLQKSTKLISKFNKSQQISTPFAVPLVFFFSPVFLVEQTVLRSENCLNLWNGVRAPLPFLLRCVFQRQNEWTCPFLAGGLWPHEQKTLAVEGGVFVVVH
jgi:hypothetical protein